MLLYKKIFQQTFEICKNHKFLRSFGLFLVLGQTVSLILNWSDKQVDLSRLSSNWQSVLLAGSFVILLGLIALYFRSKAGLISAVFALVEKQDTSFKKSFEVSKLFYSRLLLVSVLIQLSLLVLAMVLGTPVEYLLVQKFMVRALVLGILAGLIFIPSAVLGGLIAELSPMFVVIYDLTVKEAINRSFDLLKEFWQQVVLFGLMLFGLQVVPFVLLGFLAYYTHSLALLIASLVVFFVVEVGIVVFVQTAWVLLFLELVKPQKLDEEEPVAIPEII